MPGAASGLRLCLRGTGAGDTEQDGSRKDDGAERKAPPYSTTAHRFPSRHSRISVLMYGRRP
ncbi:hypothetical protein GCM10010277_16500 [Streptomyces longisporoflavus]|nr:hypothetical protein GCM10010277_16500 [Streptomyces longisporoflavus]